MNPPSPLPLDLTIRVGLEFIYEAALPTPIVLLIKPRNDRTQHGQQFKPAQRSAG